MAPRGPQPDVGGSVALWARNWRRSVDRMQLVVWRRRRRSRRENMAMIINPIRAHLSTARPGLGPVILCSRPRSAASFGEENQTGTVCRPCPWQSSSSTFWRRRVRGRGRPQRASSRAANRPRARPLQSGLRGGPLFALLHVPELTVAPSKQTSGRRANVSTCEAARGR